MSIFRAFKARVKSTRRTPRPAAPFGEGILEPEMSCRILENDNWHEDRLSGVDRDACRYTLQVFRGSELVQEHRAFSWYEVHEMARGIAPDLKPKVVQKAPAVTADEAAKAITPQRRAQHTAADERWWMLVSLGILPPISGGAPRIDDRYDTHLERLASDYEATDRLERGLDASGAFIGHDE